MNMNSGSPAKPVVKVGDIVKVGQLIGEIDGKVSSPVHASVSGTVKSIIDIDSNTGQKAVSVVIASDGEQSLYEGIAPPTVTNLEQFLGAVSDSGVVGLGGAGYPTAPKLTFRESVKLDYILINGAECEPYITSDTRTMLDETEYVMSRIWNNSSALSATAALSGSAAPAIRRRRSSHSGNLSSLTIF